MAKTRKYNQRKSTRGKTPKKKNKMRQKGGKKISTIFKVNLKKCNNDDDCIFHEKGGNSYKGDCIERKCQNVKKTTRVVRTSYLPQPRTLRHTSSGSYYVNNSMLGRLQEAYINYTVPSNAYRRSRPSF